MRILIVEDDQNIAMLYKEILEEEGFEVDVARDGVEGLEKVKQNVCITLYYPTSQCQE